jgi:hypothetical protein
VLKKHDTGYDVDYRSIELQNATTETSNAHID